MRGDVVSHQPEEPLAFEVAKQVIACGSLVGSREVALTLAEVGKVAVGYEAL